MMQPTYNLAEQCIMKPFTKDLKDVCAPFSCGNGQIEQDLNDFFANDSFLYKEELLGKTYCWITKDKPYRIAHNHPRTLHFYEQNGFKFLHKTEDEEREYYHIPVDEPIHTRLMYFDLKKI